MQGAVNDLSLLNQLRDRFDQVGLVPIGCGRVLSFCGFFSFDCRLTLGALSLVVRF